MLAPGCRLRAALLHRREQRAPTAVFKSYCAPAVRSGGGRPFGGGRALQLAAKNGVSGRAHRRPTEAWAPVPQRTRRCTPSVPVQRVSPPPAVVLSFYCAPLTYSTLLHLMRISPSLPANCPSMNSSLSVSCVRGAECQERRWKRRANNPPQQRRVQPAAHGAGCAGSTGRVRAAAAHLEVHVRVDRHERACRRHETEKGSRMFRC
jgi:hypothetical protein